MLDALREKKRKIVNGVAFCRHLSISVLELGLLGAEWKIQDE